jgi:hypothetical protein
LNVKVSFPFVVNEDILASLNVTLSVKKDMAALANAKGYGPEELHNLLSQRLSEVAEDLQNIVNLNYGEYLE